MKLIFLDIDGVLNCAECFYRHRNDWVEAGKPNEEKWWSMIEQSHLEQLNRITKETGAKYVLSTAWRGDPKTPMILWGEGFTGEILGCTPHLGTPQGQSGWEYKERGREIQSWLDSWEGEPIEKYCIIDDDSDMLPHQKLFQTMFMPKGFKSDDDHEPLGLTSEIADQVIEYFNAI